MIYDMAVVGAGPAAATFVRKMCGQGTSILLIDGQSVSGAKPCGGLLAPDAQKLLAHSDLTLPKDILVDPQIFSVKTMDLRTGRIRYYPRCYINMDRRKFDQYLLSKISDKAEIVEGRCIRIQKMGDGTFALRIRTQGGEMEFQSRMIIGADGANSLVRRTFYPYQECTKYMAIQQWFPFSGKQTPFYSCIFDPETSESCSWTIHKDHWIIYGGCFSQRRAREMFERQKARVCDFLQMEWGEPEKTEACLVNRPKRMRDFVTGEGQVYLIGEAAGFISPSSFEGISSAIKSGTKLAEALKQGKDEKEVSSLYRRKTAALRWKLWLKMRKRWFMYTPWVRALIMKTGIAGISVEKENI